MSKAACIDCGDPDPGMPGPRCSPCAMDELMASAACRECLVSILREDWFGPAVGQHQPGCSLTNDPNCEARSDEERAQVRARREQTS